MKLQQEKISKLREIIIALHNSSDEPDWESVYFQILSALFKGDEEGLLTPEAIRSIICVACPDTDREDYECVECLEILNGIAKAQQLLTRQKNEERRDTLDKARTEIAELSKKLDDREIDLKEAVKAEKERIEQFLRLRKNYKLQQKRDAGYFEDVVHLEEWEKFWESVKEMDK